MAGVPFQIDAHEVLDYLTGLPGVQYVYDLHIWATSTTENTLTAHLIMPSGGNDELLHQIAEHLFHHFSIHHTTIQIEQSDSGGICSSEHNGQQGRCWPGKMETASTIRPTECHSH
jgi:cobalt-zinc-cadmium efflux system protein